MTIVEVAFVKLAFLGALYKKNVSRFQIAVPLIIIVELVSLLFKELHGVRQLKVVITFPFSAHKAITVQLFNVFAQPVNHGVIDQTHACLFQLVAQVMITVARASLLIWEVLGALQPTLAIKFQLFVRIIINVKLENVSVTFDTHGAHLKIVA